MYRLRNIFTLLISVSWIYAQNPAKLIYEGNKAYKNNDFQTAINKYNEALKIQPNNKKALYNLGYIMYKQALMLKFSNQQAINIQNKDSIANLMLDRAAELFQASSQLYTNADTLQKVYHNIGNCKLLQKKYDEAIQEYKKSLKLNPKDEDTRYNLAYALKHKNDKKGGGQNNQQQQKQNQQQQQQQQPKISKEQAERLLQTLIQKEQELQNKKKEQKGTSTSKPEKDW